MQRQKSILSFLRKQSSENPSSGASSYTGMLHHRRMEQFPPKPSPGPVGEASDLAPEEAFGTETPPEKPQRRVLPLECFADNEAGVQPFSGIMKAFSIDDEPKSMHERIQHKNNSSYSKSISIDDGQVLNKEKTSFHHPLKDEIGPADSDYGFRFLNLQNVPHMLEPETPAMRPLVPRVKRILEDGHKPSDKCCLTGSSKRIKLLKDFGESMIPSDSCEATGSKFEWLDPSMIRDADRRRPSDALYDKRTLHIPPDAMKKMSASQRQYWTVKCQYMDVVLFFKVGKFYELYELDAEIGHKELDWKITNSGVGKCRQVGISESGIDDAVQKLVARGYKVGRMEQIETAGQAKARGTNAVIERKLVHVFTPSTTTDGNIGPDAVHLLALKEGHYDLENHSRVYGFAFLDYAALKIWVGSVCDDASCSALGALLVQISPKEVVYESKGFSSETHKALKKYASAGSAMQLSPMPPGTAFTDASEVGKLVQLKGYFKRSSHSQASGLDIVLPNEIAICALGGLIDQLSRLMLHDALFNGEIFPYQVYSSCLRMDGQTLLNLEIFSNNAEGGPSGTLYKYLDNCITSAGKRLLRNWICHPLKNIGEINDRLNAVDSLVKRSEITFVTVQYLRKLPDLERLLGRVKASIGNSARLVLPSIGEKVLKQNVKAFGSLVKGLQTGVDLLVILQKEDTGLSSLSKVLNLPLLSSSNGVLDLLSQIEAAMDDNFPKYQDHDVKDSDAETLSVLVELFAGKISLWSQVINALSCVDVLRSFAVTASSLCGCMCRPVLVAANCTSMVSSQETGAPMLKIKGLWHPYAFGGNRGEPVPNDINLGEGTAGYCPSSLLLTGPNMGGKSTLLRAICLAVIMAQLGCYVPCEICVLSPVDIIFTRLGATDRIMMGESTFLIECSETASVLQNATQDSLVLLDELGRGTSTFDGYAIAYAVFRHLVEKVHCRLLFATHYHPLTKEFASHPHVSLQHMACSFNFRNRSAFTGNQELVFLYKLTLGPCAESYGLQVALMAGISKHVVQSASKASKALRRSIGENFRSSEARSEFSTLHEEWLKTILALSMTNDSDVNKDDFDTLLLLWHELKGCYALLKGKE